MKKTCNKCGLNKVVENFRKHARTKDGYRDVCKQCLSVYDKKYNNENYDARRQWRDQNEERLREYHKQYHSEYYPANYDKIAARKRNYYIKHPEKRNSFVAVQRALRNGSLEKSSCEKCGSPEVEAHHDDYSRPLDVNWLCRSCHALKRRRAA